jgi:hypothetical protein
MRKSLVLIFVMVLGLSVMSSGVVAAQKKVALVPGELIKGEITDKVYEVMYSFSGKKGQIITLEILPDPEQPDLDPTIELRNSDGETIAKNDDFSYPLALVIAELPYDGDYIAVAGRPDGESGTSTGAYQIRLNEAQLVKSGDTISDTVNSDIDAAPKIYIMRPEKSGTLDLTLSQEPGDVYVTMSLLKWTDDSYSEALVTIDDTSKLHKATMTVDVEANEFYVFDVQQTSYSFSDPIEFPFTIELN